MCWAQSFPEKGAAISIFVMLCRNQHTKHFLWLHMGCHGCVSMNYSPFKCWFRRYMMLYMMTSWHGNAFHITDSLSGETIETHSTSLSLSGESTSGRPLWIPLKKKQWGVFFVVSINMLHDKQSTCRWCHDAPMTSPQCIVSAYVLTRPS